MGITYMWAGCPSHRQQMYGSERITLMILATCTTRVPTNLSQGHRGISPVSPDPPYLIKQLTLPSRVQSSEVTLPKSIQAFRRPYL